MARLLQITLIFAGAALAYAMDSAEELAPQEGNDAVYEPSDFRYKRTPFLTLPRLTWGWPSPPIDRDRLAYEVGKKNSGRNMHRRFAFGIGKRNPYDRYFDGDEYGNSRYMYDAPPRQYRQKKYDFGLGKREVSTADLMEMQKEEQQQQQHRVKRSLEQVNDDNDDDDVDELMEQRLQRGSYKFGLGKRKNFNFGLGKRYYEDVDDDSDDDGYLYQEDKRGKSYSFGLGKRGNGNKQYSFGLGKREDEDLEMDEIKRAKAYGFGLGKRERNSKNYNFGLGKRSKNYSFGLGKREDSESSANEDKRGRKGNQYGFGLGKRAQVDAAETQNAVSNNAHAESSNNDV